MSALDFFDGIIANAKGSVNTSMLCRIENFKGNIADVQPLVKGKSLLTNLPILKRSREETVLYEKGDIVLVVFVSHSIDGLEESQGLNDGIIAGLVTI